MPSAYTSMNSMDRRPTVLPSSDNSINSVFNSIVGDRGGRWPQAAPVSSQVYQPESPYGVSSHMGVPSVNNIYGRLDNQGLGYPVADSWSANQGYPAASNRGYPVATNTGFGNNNWGQGNNQNGGVYDFQPFGSFAPAFQGGRNNANPWSQGPG